MGRKLTQEEIIAALEEQGATDITIKPDEVFFRMDGGVFTAKKKIDGEWDILVMPDFPTGEN